MLEKVKQLGLGHVEGFNWQAFSKDKLNVKTDSNMSAADRREMRKRLDDAGLKMEFCYISRMEKKDDVEKTFEWGKDLGIKHFVSEPPPEAFGMVEELCNKYEINLALHNHPLPSRYFNPDTTLKMCKEYGKRIGACCDTGHWVRSNFDPVEALRKLEGHIISLHLKDVDQIGKVQARCVPWGTGKGRIEDIMKELHRQGFEGTFSIEYEPYSPKNFDKITQCIDFFKEVQEKIES
jgi:sugar phosphate isomerase/epimerase